MGPRQPAQKSPPLEKMDDDPESKLLPASKDDGAEYDEPPEKSPPVENDVSGAVWEGGDSMGVWWTAGGV